MAAPSAAHMPVLALRGSEGISMFDGPPSNEPSASFAKNCSRGCKVMKFSDDGSHFALCDATSVKVFDSSTFRQIVEIDKPRTVGIQFSPCNTFLATWEPYMVTKDIPAGTPNQYIWEVQSGNPIKGFVQKKQYGWCPQWTSDETICARNVNNEVHFFENRNFDVIVQKLHLQKISDFKIPAKADAPNHQHVAAYVPGSKGQPSFVRIYQYPNFGGPQAALANKSFYKADKVEMVWNRKGTSVLVLASTDSSVESYYGDQGLHYVDVRGESCLVPRGKNGPVYHVEWSPKSTEFCVIYGFMPAKATLFNLKCEAVFDFGTGPRNVSYYNPQGNILCLAGFGNLSGNMEFWDLGEKRLVSNPQSPDSTYFEWSSDGQHFATATLSPRLRVGNGFKVWKYTGEELHSHLLPSEGELWEVTWQPSARHVFPEFSVASPRPQGKSGAAPKVGGDKPAAYVPPAMRNRVVPVNKPLYREEYEPDSKVKQLQEAAKPENLSKSALKNKKKREAKARQKFDATEAPPCEQLPPAAAAAVSHTQTHDSNAASSDNDKKARNIRKKLQAIEKLKAQQAAGQELEKNQVDKLKTEEDLLTELRNLGFNS